ncbi:Peptidase M1, alanine aminopeptidase/leukotriene A4 hydrolase [Plasmopara halstedii]|uniref:Peptidase M1, alanine aminopeptidase/leukotriene A4 hydrolase n=1 Tax=Plasmopara halstedii TaxID=4781 RepID=A0A0P1B650_PLAHL|nr:Peptidase M1, alanine aminopeptidase/leukotriene A4 hydrolase [Plasmopara halstedii]CEG49833.1 Peptidase M1, alanine aminopeptidase/leukotriene A4 hydrolase [Plasmopara halstedii]|eukprot:XP_024586202.1 Peptidase M1, alanine aminopeptidase/leukotriene A4 hydrolase [Plasmopara halstedii]
MTPLAANDEINDLIQVPTGAKGWMKLNLNQAEFYLVNCSPALRKHLEVPVKDQTLGVPDPISIKIQSLHSLALASWFFQLHRNLPVFTLLKQSLCWMEVSRNLGYFLVTKRFTINFSAIFARLD